MFIKEIRKIEKEVKSKENVHELLESKEELVEENKELQEKLDKYEINYETKKTTNKKLEAKIQNELCYNEFLKDLCKNEEGILEKKN